MESATKLLRGLLTVLQTNTSATIRNNVNQAVQNLANVPHIDLVSLVNSILQHVKSHKLFFSDVSCTKSEIEKRYRLMSRLFHSNGLNFVNLHEDLKAIANILFRELGGQRDQCIKYNANYDIAHHIQQAETFYQTALNYSHSPTEAASFAAKAAAQYREVCRKSDAKGRTSDMITYRTKVSAMLVLQNHFLEAQIYTLGALKLVGRLYDDRPDQKASLTESLQRNLVKIREKASRVEHPPPPPVPHGAHAPVPTAGAGGVSTEMYTEIALLGAGAGGVCTEIALLGASRAGLSTALCHFILSADRQLVAARISSQAIHARQEAALVQRAAGIGGGVLAGAVGGGMAMTGGYTVVTTVGAIAGGVGAVTLGPVLLVGLGVSAVITGLLFGKATLDTARVLHREADVRVELNKVLDVAQSLYHERKFAEFLEALSVPINMIESSDNDQILRYVPLDRSKVVDITGTVKFLIEHGVMADGVAYILNCVGDALASGTWLDATTNRPGVIANSVHVFNEIITSQFLIDEAKKKDKEKGVMDVDNIGSLLLSLFGNKYSDSTEEDDAAASENFKKMSVTQRLQEVIVIAKMNLAMMYIVESDSKSMRLGEALLNEVTHFYKDCPCAEVINEKLETLRDFMSAFGVEFEECIEAKPNDINTLPEGLVRDVSAAVYGIVSLPDLCELERTISMQKLEGDIELYVQFYGKYISTCCAELALHRSQTCRTPKRAATCCKTWNSHFAQLSGCLSKLLCSLYDSDHFGVQSNHMHRSIASSIKLYFSFWFDQGVMPPTIAATVERLNHPSSFLQAVNDLPPLSLLSLERVTTTRVGDEETDFVDFTLYIDQANLYPPAICSDFKGFLQHSMLVGDPDPIAVLGRAYFSSAREDLLHTLKVAYDGLETMAAPQAEIFRAALRNYLPTVHAVLVRPLEELVMERLSDLDSNNVELLECISIKARRVPEEAKAAWIHSTLTLLRTRFTNLPDRKIKIAAFKVMFPVWMTLYITWSVKQDLEKSQEPSAVVGLIDSVREKVVGHAGAVTMVCNALAAPVGPSVRSFLFPGPSGIGKTEFAKVIAKVAFQGRLLRIDMNNYQEDHTVSNLVGSPKGYKGCDTPGELVVKYIEVLQGGNADSTAHLPCVILLDEFEKAADKVQKFFLQMLEESYFTANKPGTSGEAVNFSVTKCFVFVTSNLLAPQICDWFRLGQTREQIANQVVEYNKRTLKISNEVMGRCDVIPFGPLSRAESRQVVEINLALAVTTFQTEFESHEVIFTARKAELITLIARRTYTDGTQLRNIQKFLKTNFLNFIGTKSGVRGNDVELTLGNGETMGDDGDEMMVRIYRYDDNLEERMEVKGIFFPLRVVEGL